MRSVLYILATAMYVLLLVMAILSVLAGSSYYLNLGFPPAVIGAGMYIASYFALMAAMPLLVQWKLKGVKWGALSGYTLVLGVALCLQATRQDLLNQEGLAMALTVLAIGSAGLSVYCFYKKLQFVKAVLKAMRQSGRR
ncbi:MAG: hypothetical protein WAV50_02150 [Minisyncoccia bacterium]